MSADDADDAVVTDATGLWGQACFNSVMDATEPIRNMLVLRAALAARKHGGFDTKRFQWILQNTLTDAIASMMEKMR